MLRSESDAVRESVRYVLDSLGIFWEEVSEPDPLKHTVALIPEGSPLVPIPVPSVFIGRAALAYFGGEKKTKVGSPPEPSGFITISGERAPVYGQLYSFEGDRIVGYAPVWVRDRHVLIGYDLFETVSYFIRGAEQSLGLRDVIDRRGRFDPKALEELRGVPPSVPLVKLHSDLVLASLALLHKREGLPFLTKLYGRTPANLTVSLLIPVRFIRREGKFKRVVSKLLGKNTPPWYENLASLSDPLAFYFGSFLDYDLNSMEGELRSIEENGHEVGLLASIRSSVDFSKMRDEYTLISEILRRGSLGIRFPVIATYLKDAWRSAASVNARYSVAGELSGGFGYPLGLNYPSRPYGLVWNLPLTSRVRSPEAARGVVRKLLKYGGMVAVEAYTEDAAIAFISAAKDSMAEVDTPLELLKRWERIKWVKGDFVYDRRFLYMKFRASDAVEDMGVRVIHPSGKHKIVRISLSKGEEREHAVEVV